MALNDRTVLAHGPSAALWVDEVQWVSACSAVRRRALLFALILAAPWCLGYVHVVMVCAVMVDIDMDCIVMAHAVMAHVVMAYVVMVNT